MIVTSVQHLVNYVRDSIQTRIYKTIQNPVTGKKVITCEVYTRHGVVERTPDKGNSIDKKT
jgi:hypothetical protein